MKIVTSKDYNYIFNSKDGFFARWGATKEEDPEVSPFGPEILDIEISTECKKECPWCYKSNTAKGTNMTLETYKKILSKIPNNLTQVAFGIGSIDTNPDLWAIMQYTREQGYIPNITINGERMSPLFYDRLAALCGAVAVSNYNVDTCYNCVEELNRARRRVSKATLQQVNIHQILSTETYNRCMKMLTYDIKNDPRLVDLNATVFLLLKPKGNRNNLTRLRDTEKYQALVDYAIKHSVSIGFDSCSAPSFSRALKNGNHDPAIEKFVEPCESTLFSLYVDVEGRVWPCSFCEELPNIEPVNLLEAEDFLSDVWNAPPISSFRTKLCNNCRECPVFDIEINKELAGG